MTRVRAFAIALLAPLVGAALLTLAWRDAHASLSLAVTWEALVRESSAAVIVTPGESSSLWEDGRIVTYTRVHVDRAMAGDLAAGADAWVRTLGGVVGKVGQIVDGEAVFSPGRASLVFLRPGPVGALDVTARGQGQFPVVADADPARPARIVRSHAVGALLAPRAPTPPAGPLSLAADVLHGRVIDEAAQVVAAAWAASHAR